jgi:hypothetical protein
VLRCIGVGAGEQDPVVGELGEAVPHLLPVDDVLVAVEHRARAQRREVRAGAGLAVELAPQLVAAEDRVDVLLLLLLGAVRNQRGHDHPHRDRERAHRHVELRLLLVEDRLLHAGAPAAAVLLRQGDPRPSLLVEGVLPLARPVHVLLEPRRAVAALRRRGVVVEPGGVLLEPRPRLGPEGRLLGRVADLHAVVPFRAGWLQEMVCGSELARIAVAKP